MTGRAHERRAAHWEPRFWARVAPISCGCWRWDAALDRDGYGRFKIDGKTLRAHRVAHEILVGPIPAGLHIDHLCRNRWCVNPDHLEPVTCRENLMRGNTHHARNTRKTHCKHGHPFDARNTIVQRNGARKCKTCSRAHTKAWCRRHRAEQRAARQGAAKPTSFEVRAPKTARVRAAEPLDAVAGRLGGVRP